MRLLHRPFAALLAQLLVIHFAIMSGALACPMEHGGAGAAPASHAGAVAHPSSGHGSHQSPHHSHADDTTCETSAGHCGVASERVTTARSDARPDDARPGVPRRLDAPPSVASAPEPPPPRA